MDINTTNTYGQPTIAAIATPPGVGGLSVIRISGDDAYSVAAKVFTPQNSAKNLKNAKGYTALFGKMKMQGKDVDEGIALCFRTPHSYTGEDVVELSCHGGNTVSAAVLSACITAGAKPAAAGEFTRRAVLNGRMSLTQAEAVMEIIAASSRRGAALAKAALDGNLQKTVEKTLDDLVRLAAHLAAFTDYPEEDVERLPAEDFLRIIDDALNALQPLVEDYDRGSLLRDGVQVAIVGSPNVGKSTLFNLLAGFKRAIVTPVAGTTRDVVSETIVMDGITFNLADTAGLRSTPDEVEKEGISRSIDEIDKAGFVLAVFDGSKAISDEDKKIFELCASKPCVCVVNKSDLGVVIDEELLKEYFSEIIIISAVELSSIEEVKRAILNVLRVQDVDVTAPSLINRRQLAAAQSACDALHEAKNALNGELGLDAAGICLDDAVRELATLIGKDASEEVMNEVFSRFCVGK